MNYFTHNEGDIDVHGTSSQGDLFGVRFSQLVAAFGKPNGGDEYKSDAEWDIEFSCGTIATVYNWKDGKNYNGDMGLDVDDITHWHVGGTYGSLELVEGVIRDLSKDGINDLD